MDLYTRKSHWKWYLAAGAVLIISASMLYTKHLAEQLSLREEQQAKLWAEAQKALNKMQVDTFQFFHCDLTLPARVLELNSTIPVVLVNNSGQIEDALNVPGSEGKDIDTALIRKALREMFRNGVDSVDASIPPEIYKKVYFARSKLLAQLWWYPLVQLGLIAAFVAFGYLGFSSARRSEQNQVWLGMAKETAHQLGTPITAILGWIETLKAVNEERPDNLEMLDELRNDVTRLELVADRFSKIGAMPELKSVNLFDELETCKNYMQRRAPRKVHIEFPEPATHQPLMVNLNPHLFDWVIENLLRNAIDAMEDGSGHISAIVYEEGRYACVEVSDTGKGIPPGKFKTVFKPGYSTKTRGWGLGLSLAKRIIEDYHGGKIYVKRSELQKGSTFMVKVLKTK
jgi:two-component sensor histidine kinase